jgi:hypothetical protein
MAYRPIRGTVRYRNETWLATQNRFDEVCVHCGYSCWAGVVGSNTDQAASQMTTNRRFRPATWSSPCIRLISRFPSFRETT